MRKFTLPLYILFLLPILLVNCRAKDVVIPDNPYASWSLREPGLQRRSLNFPLGEEWDARSQPLDQMRRETLIAINEIDGIKDRPIASDHAQDFISKLSGIKKSFPEKVNEQFNKYVFAIYFVKNLGSSALSGIIRYNKDPIGGIIFIDTDWLGKPANEWATAKEKTVFSFGSGEDLKLVLEKEENNTVSNALAFILLHEFGHIISIVDNVSPDYSLPKRDFRSFPFFKDIWLSEVESEHDSELTDKKKIKFYSKGMIPFGSEGIKLYSELEDTPFVTLYASTNADDTFAEAYASYVHVVLQGKPYEVHAINGSESKLIFENGISRSSGKSQRLFLNKIFGIKE
ncbi:hypothetical protein EHQ58_05625 [Leptospira ognonensis]|uniref:Uncharacterized protein n=1 Tax=Leptospira ognonensis TaxID=2484945 RepID=A0A4R9K6R1_9LEPT|nr:hypothetical protein [Leptospira ognonensis]TGL61256.1 hypothetical protein EHQ58_05625 [Leptospira ognonensis]